jgi:hypothetical protein
MSPETEVSFRRHLLDPEFWRSRLTQLRTTPRRLLLYPRPEQSRPGMELVEFQLCAHDGKRLQALLAHRSFGQRCEMIRIRACEMAEPCQIDWEAVGDGITDLVLDFPASRRLPDRVLDTLRVSQAACSIESVGLSEVVFGDGAANGLNDALCIAEMIRSRGWI